MPSPTAEQLTETITHAIGVSAELKTDAGWLWTDAYWPPTRDRDRPSRPLPRGVDPDVVPGRRLDLGLGNDQARAAYTTAAILVSSAHRLAGLAAYELTARRRPPVNQRPARGDLMGPTVDSTVRRLRGLLQRDIATVDNDQARRHAHAAAVALIEAHVALAAVMRDVDGTGEPGSNRRCRNCGDPAPPSRSVAAVRCANCARYWQRTGRERRIRRHEDARRARVRRGERGEGQARNPLPGGRYVDGVWTPAVPHSDREAS